MFGFSKKIKSPKEAYYFAKEKDERILELESIIAKDSKYSYFYAKNIIKGRFKLGEKAISKDIYYSYAYAKNVLKDRFEKGEEEILVNSRVSIWASFYMKEFLKCFLEFEIDDEFEGSYLYDNNFAEEIKANKPKEINKILNAKDAKRLNNIKSDNLNFDDLIEQIEGKIITQTKEGRPANGVTLEVDFARLKKNESIKAFSQLLLDAGYYVSIDVNHKIKRFIIRIHWIHRGCNVCGYMFKEIGNLFYCNGCLEDQYFYEE